MAFGEINIGDWREFRSAMEALALHRKEVEAANNNRTLEEPLFRGLGNHEWKLETTLERSADVQSPQTLIKYYRRAERSKPAVESLTEKFGTRFQTIQRSKLPFKLLHSGSRMLSNNPAIYQYLIYLRRHSFPSPLLDWTASPYVAATFAFDARDKNATHVCIYAWFRDTIQTFGSGGHLFVVGPYIRTHPRHYSQQSRYSLFLQLDWTTGSQITYDYNFVPHHQQLINENQNHDLVVSMRIPSAEYRTALMDLDTMNLNPYSLYGSEESLIHTVARRELLFK